MRNASPEKNIMNSDFLLTFYFISDKENNAKNNRFEGKRVLDARRTNDGPREERNNQRNQRDGEVRRGDDDGERRGGGRGRGRGGPGGDRGGRGRGGPGGRGGKREFDRKSGDSRTGIKPEEKRGGSGKGNWGNFEDDVKVGNSRQRRMILNIICFLGRW